MIRLYIPAGISRLLARDALSVYPHEGCGILLGTGNEVKQFVSVPNVATTPSNAYVMDEQVLVQAFFSAKKQGFEVVGFYHSHPDNDPIPSQVDVSQAHYPDTAYVIVGVRGRETQVAAWSINNRRVYPVDVILTPKPDFEPPDEEFSLAQKRAIAVATVISVIFMIILSLSLLPPAPAIVTPLP